VRLATKRRHEDIKDYVLDGIKTRFAIEVFDEDGAPYELKCPCGWTRSLLGDWPDDEITRFHFTFCKEQPK